MVMSPDFSVRFRGSGEFRHVNIEAIQSALLKIAWSDNHVDILPFRAINGVNMEIKHKI